MIKSLLEPEENQPEKIKTESEEKPFGDSAVGENFESYFVGIESPPDANEPENLLEIYEPAAGARVFSEELKETMPAELPGGKTAEAFDFTESHFNQPENSYAETINYEPLVETANERTDDEPLAGFPIDEVDFDTPSAATVEKPDFNSAAAISNETTNYESPAETKAEKPPFENSDLLFQSSAEPESFAETARKSGMAYAAAITLFGSIVFMLIIGWFADLLLGSSPLGVVGGILLGAAIGFFNFSD